jgi:hypothetical protein
MNEESRGLYVSPSIVRAVKFSRLRWLGNVAAVSKTGNV